MTEPVWALDDGDVKVLLGDAREQLRLLPDESVHCCVTSPPFWGLRDYGTAVWVPPAELEAMTPAARAVFEACDHVVPSQGGTQSSTLHQWPGNTLTAESAGQKSTRSFVGYREVCGRCGAVRRDAQIGLERTPEAWVESLVEVFREVRRVLRPDGTLWLEVGDSYAGAGPSGASYQSPSTQRREGGGQDGAFRVSPKLKDRGLTYADKKPHDIPPGLKPKDLVGAPWMLAFALRADGWWLRMDNVWARPNPMPESVTDRPTKAHSYVFLLSKSARYFYDAEAIRSTGPERVVKEPDGWDTAPGGHGTIHRDGRSKGKPAAAVTVGANARSVWTIPTQPSDVEHFAMFPEALVARCINAATSEHGCCGSCGAPYKRLVEVDGQSTRAELHERGPAAYHASQPNGNGQALDHAGGHGDRLRPRRTVGWQPTCACRHPQAVVPCTVLDPFFGAGTTALVARRLGRRTVGVELSPKYLGFARDRLAQLGLFSTV